MPWIRIAGVFHETNLEVLHRCLEPLFPGADYRYKPLIEIYIEHKDFDYWLRDDDRYNESYAEGDMDFLFSGTYLKSYREARQLVIKIIEVVGSCGIKCDMEMAEETRDGKLLSDMEEFSNIKS